MDHSLSFHFMPVPLPDSARVSYNCPVGFLDGRQIILILCMHSDLASSKQIEKVDADAN